MLMVMVAIILGCIDGSLDDTVGHTNAQYGECIPQAAHENHMAHVPDPFKIKREHTSSSCLI